MRSRRNPTTRRFLLPGRKIPLMTPVWIPKGNPYAQSTPLMTGSNIFPPDSGRISTAVCIRGPKLPSQTIRTLRHSRMIMRARPGRAAGSPPAASSRRCSYYLWNRSLFRQLSDKFNSARFFDAPRIRRRPPRVAAFWTIYQFTRRRSRRFHSWTRVSLQVASLTPTLNYNEY